MKYAADFRREAREALFGRWSMAVLVGFVASLLGGTSGGSVNLNLNNNASSNGWLNDWKPDGAGTAFVLVLLALCLLLLTWGVVLFIVSGPVQLGYARFNLNLIDRKEVKFSDLFSGFHRFGAGFCMNLLMSLYLLFWSLLFIIPGIVKNYSYAMTPYILLEHPEMSANEAITESRRMMNGNKGRLFCLEFSFIGWALLLLTPTLVLVPLAATGILGALLWALLAVGLAFVGSLFLTPYREAARAAFYREISDTEML